MNTTNGPSNAATSASMHWHGRRPVLNPAPDTKEEDTVIGAISACPTIEGSLSYTTPPGLTRGSWSCQEIRGEDSGASLAHGPLPVDVHDWTYSNLRSRTMVGRSSSEGATGKCRR